MTKANWWDACSVVLWAGVWGALAWITLDPDLQATEDLLLMWMLPIAAAPVMLVGLGETIFERGGPGDGGAAFASGTDCDRSGTGAGSCGGGCGGCGGCGG
ncbi:hypothetical protein ACFXPI_13410 [Streptomyces sp. NPDC059104]|uniref:hypothetical protein n=1 Tax=Streptomyces sp. NPDC059104 TaxID=3346729 RepID=UPI0036A7E216